jgi:hypothetical protein
MPGFSLTIGQIDAKIRLSMLRLEKAILGHFFTASLGVMVVLSFSVAAQTIVDKTVATVSDGIQTELITLSDLRWQLALQPRVNLQAISSEDLKRALETTIDQRIFALEAKRLPRDPVTKEEIAAEVKTLIRPGKFSTAAELEARLRQVGFTSIDDDNFQRIIADRIAIEKYLEFRFRSFIVITAADEAKYFRDVEAPEFRRRFPGILMPTLEEKRAEIHNKLVEQKVESDIESFLEDAKQRVKVTRLSEV